jgi:hypothetical protein
VCNFHCLIQKFFILTKRVNNKPVVITDLTNLSIFYFSVYLYCDIDDDGVITDNETIDSVYRGEGVISLIKRLFFDKKRNWLHLI